MTVPLPHYAKIKDRYCIAYFGNCNEYLIQLKLLRPLMETEFPGIQVYLACKEESSYLLENEPRILTRETLKQKKGDFAYIRELSCNMREHPIEEFMNESEIPFKIEKPSYDGTSLCLISPLGSLPTKSLNNAQIDKAIVMAQNRGYSTKIGTDLKGVGWVIGVENETLFTAASKGIDTTLIKTGLGSCLFAKMFPYFEVDTHI